MKPAILSTRKLSISQKELLLNGGLGVVEKNFIKIVPVEYSVPFQPENVIFTSKNAVNIVLENQGAEFLQGKQVFCVGKKTAKLLKSKEVLVTASEHYGADLAQKIVKNYPKEKFLYFCGKNRRPELPNFLIQHEVKLTEVPVYDSIPLPQKVERDFDGIFFFSPSAVKSYFTLNKLGKSICFCIGKTTAVEAEKYTQNIKIASKPSVENVIAQAVKNFK